MTNLLVYCYCQIITHFFVGKTCGRCGRVNTDDESKPLLAAGDSDQTTGLDFSDEESTKFSPSAGRASVQNKNYQSTAYNECITTSVYAQICIIQCHVFTLVAVLFCGNAMLVVW